MKLDTYDKIIISKRQRTSSNPNEAKRLSTETESDRGRIVFSNSFRRLQQKAQVFPLETNAAVRTRLTHSLEVAHTGRSLARAVLENFEKENIYGDSWLRKNEQAFSDVVESACLIHDIGNPPFGHFGEAAIKDWFQNNTKRLFKRLKKQGLNEEDLDKYKAKEFYDFLTFDGNAQGLRLITKLQGDDGSSGLNLTYTLLSAYMKYSSLPQDIKVYNPQSTSKKPGFFNTEENLLMDVWDSLKMKPFTRHPLSYLMEAADDIAYCLSDIEDGMEKGILSEEVFFEKLEKEWSKECKVKGFLDTDYLPNIIRKSSNNPLVNKYTLFKTSLQKSLISYAAKQYIKNHDEIINGTGGVLIQGEIKEQGALNALRMVVGKYIFQSNEAEEVELAGYSVISGLLNHFQSLLELSRDDFSKLCAEDSKYIKDKNLDYQKRLLNRLSGKARKSYEVFNNEELTSIEEWHLRAHMIIDHISGMTDGYALKTFQLLSGIKVVTN